MRFFKRKGRPVMGAPVLPEPRLVSAKDLLEEEMKGEEVKETAPGFPFGVGFFQVRGKSGSLYLITTRGSCLNYCISPRVPPPPTTYTFEEARAALAKDAGPIAALTLKALIEANEGLFHRVANKTGAVT